MKSARIIATTPATTWLSSLTDGLAAAGFSVDSSPSSHPPAPHVTAAGLLLALDLPLELFAAACSEAISATPPLTGCRLAIHVAGVPSACAPPPSLPAFPPARDAEIRRLAHVCAPHMRVNAITAVYSTAGGIDAIAGEILAAVMLFLQCPAMTGVVIPIDRPADATAADATAADVRQLSESRS